ncbi:hypothetical protein WA026_015258 [Henosepilachna vigintioctopunctata]|uniref:Protein SGT1 homolog n=1 Tax=Henosepilachna vigintioctopunctata TaxID=420089 RepID=A0AAW1TV88_9CUCU
MDNQSTKNSLKHDWYQTETSVVITVLLRNIKEEQLTVQFFEKNVKLDITGSELSDNISRVFDLSHTIVPDQCSFKITPAKIEIKLKKCEGLRWDKLEGQCDNVKSIPQGPVPTTGNPLSYPTSKGKDWSAIEKDIKAQESQEKPEGEEALNKLFQEIYGKGSDEVKKAMNKSFMESGGTVLSTNWKEVCQDKVECKPPDGMEFKKWDS